MSKTRESRTIPVSHRFERESIQAIEAIAEAESKTRSEVINTVIKRGLGTSSESSMLQQILKILGKSK